MDMVCTASSPRSSLNHLLNFQPRKPLDILKCPCMFPRFHLQIALLFQGAIGILCIDMLDVSFHNRWIDIMIARRLSKQVTISKTKLKLRSDICQHIRIWCTIHHKCDFVNVLGEIAFDTDNFHCLP